MIPIIIQDNFFKYPEKVLKLCNSCNFDKSTNGSWPGLRSINLHQIDYNFFKIFHSKVFSILYPYNHSKLEYSAGTVFQKINGNNYQNEGWIHNDPNEITIIVYLSKHEDCGTSFWEPKLFETNIHNEKKQNVYLNKLPKEEEPKYLKENNDQFTKILDVKSKFNRALIFDAKKFHSANKFNDPNDASDRLTLISFVDKLTIKGDGFKLGTLESMRID